VTHGIAFLPQVDQIIVLQDGRISEVCVALASIDLSYQLHGREVFTLLDIFCFELKCQSITLTISFDDFSECAFCVTSMTILLQHKELHETP